MVQPVKDPIHTVLRAGYANPLALGIKVTDPSYVNVYVDEEQLDPDTYTITGIGSDDGVEITILGVDPDWYPDALTVTAAFEPPINQPADLSAGGIFGIAYEDAVDSIVRIILSLKGGLDRTLKVPYGVEGNIVLPFPVPGASIAWDEFGTGFINGPSTADISIITPYLPAIAGVFADIDAVIVTAASIDNVDSVAASIGNVNAVAAALPNISVIVSFQSELQTVVDNIAPILVNAANIDAIIAAKGEADRAQQIADQAEEDLRAIVGEPGPTAPATPVEGQLWYNTTLQTIMVYGVDGWEPAVSSTLGGLRTGSGVFSAGDAATFAVAGSFQFIMVWRNGAVQRDDAIVIDGTEVTITGAAVGDEWRYWAYQALDATDYYTKADTNDLVAGSMLTLGWVTERNGDLLPGCLPWREGGTYDTTMYADFNLWHVTNCASFGQTAAQALAGILPDFRDYSPRIAGGTLGPAVGVKQEDALQGHGHAISNGTDGLAYVGSGAGGGGTVGAQPTGTFSARTPITDGTNGTPRVGPETRAKTFGVRYQIKAMHAIADIGYVQASRVVEAANAAVRSDIDQQAQSKTVAQKVNILKNTLQAWEAISVLDVSSVTSTVVTGLEEYKSLRIRAELRPSSTAAAIVIHVGTPTGWVNTATDYGIKEWYSIGTATAANETTSAAFPLFNPVGTTDVDMQGEVCIFNLYSVRRTVFRTHSQFIQSGGWAIYHAMGSAVVGALQDRIRVISTQPFTGRIIVEGVR